MAAGAVAASCKRNSGALKVLNAISDSERTRLHSKVDDVKQLRAGVSKLGCDVERITASLTDTTNMCNEAVERADDVGAYLAASIRHEDAYRAELNAVKEELVKTHIERANLQWLVNDLVAKAREASASLGGALQAVVESLNRSYEDASGKDKVEMGKAWKRILFSFNIKYADELRRIRNVACCTALISTRVYNINVALSVEVKSDTAYASSGGLTETSEEVTIDRDGPAVEWVYT